MTRATLLALAAVFGGALTACSTLPDVNADVCGNGVVEANEDCDGDASAAGGTCGAAADGDNACHLVCEGGAACPTGYACAADLRCRAPSAIFTAARNAYAFDANDVAAGDVDGDGTADLVGVSASALTVRFGNASADLLQVASQPIRTPVAHSVFGDLDGDGHLDVMVPSSIGVFSFLASGQGFNPFPYTSLTLDDQVSSVRTTDVEVIPDPFSEILTMIGKTQTYINTKPQYAQCLDGGSPPLCVGSQHSVSDLLGDAIPTGRTGYEFGAVVAPDKDFTDEYVLAFKNNDHVDLWSSTLPTINADGSIDASTLSVAKIESLQLPKYGPLSTQVRVADDGVVAFGRFDLDGCVDLLVPVKRVEVGGKFEGIAIAYGSKVASACTGKFDAPVMVAEAEIDPTGTTAGIIPRAVVDLDGDGVSDIVTNELIAVTSCTRDQTGCAHGDNDVFALDFRSFTPRTWTAAVATDVNKDGVADIAGIVAGEDDVDVMIGGGFGFSNRFQVATSLPPLSVRTGDFDGDLFLDVAVVTGDTSAGDNEDDHLVVLFGAASGGPSAPVDMGSFGIVRDMEPISLFTDLESIDLITDVLLIADRGTHRGVAPLIGSSTRRLLAPYLLGEGPATDQAHDTPVAIQLGQFDGDAGKLPDLVALGRLVPTQSPTGGTGTTSIDSRPRMYLLAGAGGGDLVGGQPTIPDASPPNFEYQDALWVAGRLDPASSIDAVIGVDATDDRHATVQASAPYLFVATPPTTASQDWAFVLPVALPAPYASMRVHALRLADLDGDGAADLIVEMTGTTIGTGPKATTPTAAFVAWNKGGSLDIASPTAVYASDAGCRGAAPIQADLDAAKELAAVCIGAGGAPALTIYHWDGSAWTQAQQTPVSGTEPRVVVGDFNGDLVDDLAIVSGSGATASAQVYVQCPLGDTACATTTQTQTSGK